MYTLLFDPIFLAVAALAVILVGLSKGGLGGSMGMVGVPLMALVISPVQAAAILLPILIVMDLVSLWTWRGVYDRGILASMLPGAMAGIGIGWLTAALVTPDMVRLIVGVVAVAFVGRAVWLHFRHGVDHIARPNRAAAGFWGTVAGFTSFVAHVGGPPYQVYTLPLKMDPKLFTGTSVVFFAVTNAVKLVPYFALGQFDADQSRRIGRADAVCADLSTFGRCLRWCGACGPEVFYLIHLRNDSDDRGQADRRWCFQHLDGLAGSAQHCQNGTDHEQSLRAESLPPARPITSR